MHNNSKPTVVMSLGETAARQMISRQIRKHGVARFESQYQDDPFALRILKELQQNPVATIDSGDFEEA